MCDEEKGKQLRCSICNRWTKVKPMALSVTCDDCRFRLAAEFPVEMLYKDKIKELRKRYKNRYSSFEEEGLTIPEQIELERCANCIWCRNIDLAKKKAYCAFPKCIRGDKRLCGLKTD